MNIICQACGLRMATWPPLEKDPNGCRCDPIVLRANAPPMRWPVIDERDIEDPEIQERADAVIVARMCQRGEIIP